MLLLKIQANPEDFFSESNEAAIAQFIFELKNTGFDQMVQSSLAQWALQNNTSEKMIQLLNKIDLNIGRRPAVSPLAFYKHNFGGGVVHT